MLEGWLFRPPFFFDNASCRALTKRAKSRELKVVVMVGKQQKNLLRNSIGFVDILTGSKWSLLDFLLIVLILMFKPEETM